MLKIYIEKKKMEFYKGASPKVTRPLGTFSFEKLVITSISLCFGKCVEVN